MKASNGTNDGSSSKSCFDKDEIRERLSKVASTEYPFDLEEPKRKLQAEAEKLFKKKDGGQQLRRLNLKSSKNLSPVLWSILCFLVEALLCFPLGVVFSLVTCYYLVTTDSSSLSSSTSVKVFGSLSALCWIQLFVRDPFFVHWITDGKWTSLAKPSTLQSISDDGVYCKATPTNTRLSERLRKFLPYRPVPFLYSGDLITLYPFLYFKGSKGGTRVNYDRWWVKVASAPAPDGPNGPSKRPNSSNDDDDEAVAVDVSFPASATTINENKPVFLILHGLNGGSTEPYVLDLVRRANSEGCIAAVMINRGMMKTPVRGMNTFNGSRTSDVGCVVEALGKALGGSTPPRIVLVGFSMGAIIATNYVAKAGKSCGVVGCVAFSGTICGDLMVLKTSAAKHSVRLWQPALAWGLKATVGKPNEVKFAMRGITADVVENKVHSVMDIDRVLVCGYHGYDSQSDYYEDLSAAGRGDANGIDRFHSISVPTLIVHAMDDPIATFEVVLPTLIPQTDHVMLLATKHGGHIGWPTGWKPTKNRWSFMMNVAMEYGYGVCDVLDKKET